jgi:predicted aspartyl protease
MSLLRGRCAALLTSMILAFGGAARSGTTAVAAPNTAYITPATIDDTLEVVGKSVAARQVNSRMEIGVLVDGKGPFSFFVDSGADRSVIGSALAGRLNLPAGRTVLLNSMGAPRHVQTVHVDTLGVGGSNIRDVAAPVLPEQFIGAQGLVGIDALSGQRLTLDFQQRTITVQDTRAPEAFQGSADEIVVTARRRKGQLILTQANASGTNLAAVIDSGAEVTIGNEPLRAKLMRRIKTPPMSTTLLSVTGDPIRADLLIVPSIGIGGVTLRDVPIAFVDVPPFRLFGLAEQPAVLLGTDVLQAFRRVSLDFRRRKIRFLLKR